MAREPDETYDQPIRGPRRNKAATASLTLGLLSLLLSVLAGLPAIIAGIVGLGRARSRRAGRGKSVAGIALGLVSIVVLVAVVAFLVPAWTTVQSVREVQAQGLPPADSPQGKQGAAEAEKALEQVGVDPSSLECTDPAISGIEVSVSCTGALLDGSPATVDGTCPAVSLLRGSARCEATINGQPTELRVTLDDGMTTIEVL